MRQTLRVMLEMDTTWFDPRLSFKHLQKDASLNVLWRENKDRLWRPKIIFVNINPSDDHKDRNEMFKIVRNPTIPPRILNNTQVFKGSEHAIVRQMEHTHDWRYVGFCQFKIHSGLGLYRCVFDLRMYPFDIQNCKLVFKYPEYYLHFVELMPERVGYVGEPDELMEYLVDTVHLCSNQNSSGVYVKFYNCMTPESPFLSVYLLVFTENMKY